MTYTVKSGDSLSRIAARNGLTLAQLLQANPQITDPNRINVGDIVNLPDSSNPSDASDASDANEATQPLPANPVISPSSTDNTQPLPSNPAAAAGALGSALADELGCLSAKYETGGRGPGVVSTGVGDPGGVSYGSYQMASKMGVPQRFVSQAGFPWLADFQNLTAGSADFTACWKRIAANETDAFQSAQHAYIKKTHYDLLAAKILADDGLDVNTRCRTLQDVVWSTAVQHGGATSMVHKALANVTCARTDAGFDEELIRAIYAERGRKKPDGNLVYFSKSSPNVQKGVANRFQNELKDALAMLTKET